MKVTGKQQDLDQGVLTGQVPVTLPGSSWQCDREHKHGPDIDGVAMPPAGECPDGPLPQPEEEPSDREPDA